MPNSNANITNPHPNPSHRTLTIVIYALYAASLVLGGIPAIVAIVINYVKRSELNDPISKSHFIWQMRTFWFSLLYMIIAAVTVYIGIGILIGIAALVWFIYRIVRGLLNIIDNKPMPLPKKHLNYVS